MRERESALGGNHQPIRVQMFSYGDYKLFPPSVMLLRDSWSDGAAFKGGMGITRWGELD